MNPRPQSDADAPAQPATGSYGGDTKPGHRPTAPPGAPPAFLAAPRGGGELGWLGPYRVLEELGRGGMGVVFRAEDTELKRQVALKVMLPEVAEDPRAVARFRREAEAQAQVEHEHVAVIYRVGEEGGVPFIAMPLLKGQTLGAALNQNGRPPLLEVLRVGREIAEGLAAAHAVGLVHRDIKPANVWLDGPKRRVRILDFGLARAVAAGGQPLAPGDGSITRGGIVGTPAYMSPEQALGAAVDHRSDLFSLGVVLYLMATGQKPFAGQTPFSLLAAVVESDPQPPHAVEPGVPAELSALVMRLLAKRPEARPATATDVARELEAVESGLSLPAVRVVALPADGAPPDPWAEIESTIATAPVVPRAPEPPPRRAVWLWAALAALVLAGVGALAAVLLRTGAPKGALTVEADDPAWELVIRRGDETVRDRTRDREFVLPPGEYRVALADPVPNLKISPERVALTDKGAARVRLWVEKPRPAPKQKDVPPEPTPFGPEATKALEAVLAMGGSLHLIVDRQIVLFKPGDKLPRSQPFTVEHVYLDTVVGLDKFTLERFRALPPVRLSLGLSQTGITDDDLAKLTTFPGLANITGLNVAQTNVTNDGLVHVRKFAKLTSLDLSHVKVTGPGLAQLKGLKLETINAHLCPLEDDAADTIGEMARLSRVWLMYTRISDAGLKKLTGLKKVNYLHPGGFGITDASAETLLQFPALSDLHLLGTQFGDAGLKALAAHPKLHHLIAAECAITDAGLVHLKEFPALVNFGLSGNGERITDAGLKHIAAARRLMWVNLLKTAVTEAGVKELAAARPDLSIEWDGGKIVPREVQRPAAEALLPFCAQMELVLADGTKKRVRPGDALPAEPFTVRALDLAAPDATPSAEQGAALLKHAGAFPQLEALATVHGKPALTDDEFERLAASLPKALKKLVLPGTLLTPRALAALGPFDALESVGFDASKADEELFRKFLGGKRAWTHLHLSRLNGDRGARQLIVALPLRELVLPYCADFDREFARGLAARPDLAILAANFSGFGDAAAEELAKSKSLAFLSLMGCPVTDAGLEALTRAPSLKSVKIGKSKVTPAGAAKFAKLRPDVVVEGAPAGE